MQKIRFNDTLQPSQGRCPGMNEPMKTPRTTTPEELERVHRALKKKFNDKKLIFGSGLVGAKVVFVGEMLNSDGEKEAKPLAGQSEKLFHQVLKTVGLDKKKIYVTNLVKYYPNGKVPTPKELKAHAAFLKEELKSLNPSLVVTLGNLALNGVGLRQPLDNVHGRTFNFGSYELVPTFHPSYATKDPTVKDKIEKDLARLKEILKKS